MSTGILFTLAECLSDANNRQRSGRRQETADRAVNLDSRWIGRKCYLNPHYTRDNYHQAGVPMAQSLLPESDHTNGQHLPIPFAASCLPKRPGREDIDGSSMCPIHRGQIGLRVMGSKPPASSQAHELDCPISIAQPRPRGAFPIS